MDTDRVSPSSQAFGRRRYARFPVDLQVVSRAPQLPGEAIPGIVRNVSCGGLMAEFPLHLVSGCTVDLTLQTPWGPLELEGKVVWSASAKEQTHHGVAFLEPREQDFAVDLFIAGSR